MMNSISSFFKTKVVSIVTRNLSVEDQLRREATAIIDDITKLRTRYNTMEHDGITARRLAEENNGKADSAEKELKYLMKNNPERDYTTHAALILLHRRNASALVEKAEAYSAAKEEIRKSVLELDDERQNISVKLQFIREFQKSSELGLQTQEDIRLLTQNARVRTRDTLLRIETFNGESSPAKAATSSDIAEYLDSLK